MTILNKEAVRKALKLYFIMGSVNCNKDPVEVLQESIQGGITIFQYREKGKRALTGQDKYELEKKLQAVCRQAGIPFVVNDDVDLAVELDADGVHVGQEDESIESARAKIGNKKILGVSAYTVEEAKEAVVRGADYLGVGTIFPTSSKDDAKNIQGVSILREIRAAGINIPMVGIGEITINNAAQVINAGADGISVISAISSAENIVEATKPLKEKIN